MGKHPNPPMMSSKLWEILQEHIDFPEDIEVQHIYIAARLNEPVEITIEGFIKKSGSPVIQTTKGEPDLVSISKSF